MKGFSFMETVDGSLKVDELTTSFKILPLAMEFLAL